MLPGCAAGGVRESLHVDDGRGVKHGSKTSGHALGSARFRPGDSAHARARRLQTSRAAAGPAREHCALRQRTAHARRLLASTRGALLCNCDGALRYNCAGAPADFIRRRAGVARVRSFASSSSRCRGVARASGRACACRCQVTDERLARVNRSSHARTRAPPPVRSCAAPLVQLPGRCFVA